MRGPRQAPRLPAAYQGEQLTFGPDYLIPKPFDPRLMAVVASAVAEAAIASGVATRPLDDLEAYKARLNQAVFKSALIMRPVFEAAATTTRRIVFAEGGGRAVCCVPRRPFWRRPRTLPS